MSMFFGSALREEEEDEKERDGKGSAFPFLIILALLFLPAAVIAWLMYLICLRTFKQKASVSNFVATILIGSGLIYANLSEALPKAIYVFANILKIQDNWQLLVPILIAVNLVIGGVAGAIIVFVSIHQMKANPHRLHLKGDWMYGFRFNRSPLEVLKRRKTIAKLKNGGFASDRKAPLGLDEEHHDAVAYRYNSEAQKQTLISGAAGSGKTITMLSLMYNDILNNLPVIVIDFKRSPELATKLATWSAENNRKFYHFVNGDPEAYDVPKSPGQSRYDPLINGGAGKADMVLGMREYDTAAEVYKSSMRQLLQVLFAMLRQADRKKAPHIDWNHGGIGQIASAVNGTNFSELTAACEGKPIQQDAEQVDNQSRARGSNLKHAMDELQGQMRTIVASEYGRWLKLVKDGRNIDLYKLTSGEEGNVILFSLNADSEKDFSKYVGSLIFSDLNAVSSLRRNNGLKNQVNVYVDEFQAVPPTAVTSLLEKSRESRLAMTLSSQSFEQIVAASESNGEAYLLGILDTCSNFVVHNGATEDSATRLAKILGKHWETTYRQTNANQSYLFSFNWFNRRNNMIQKAEEERWIVHPKDFMSLSSPTKNNGFKSTAVIINKATDDPAYKDHKGALARTVWMIPNQRVVDEYYMPRLSGGGAEAEEAANEGLLETDDSVMDYDPMKPQRAPEEVDENLLEHPEMYVDDDEEPIYEDDEEADGDFSYEKVGEEETRDAEDSRSLNNVHPSGIPVAAKRVAAPSAPHQPKRAQSLEDLYSGVGVPKTAQTKKNQDDETDDDEDDESLPDISGLF